MTTTTRVASTLLRLGYTEHSDIPGRRRFVGRSRDAANVWIERGRVRVSATADHGDSVPLSAAELERFILEVTK